MGLTITHLTPVELAERWRTSINTLSNQRVIGNGCPYIKFGKRVLYPVVEVERFETEHLRLAVSVPAEKER